MRIDISVIIFVIHGVGIFPDEGKGDSPVSTNLHRPCSFTISLERVKI